MPLPTILQVLPKLHQTGGVERGTLEIAQAIQLAGWKSLVASESGGLLAGLKHGGSQHFKLPMSSKNPLVMWLNTRRLERIIRKYQVSLVHARSRAPAWSAYAAARRTGVPFVTTFHGVYNAKGDAKKRYNSVMVKGDLVIAVSEFIREHIMREYNVPESKIRVIHRGVDTSLFNPDAIKPQRMVELIKQWGIPEHLPIILFPGRITRWKGQDVFIKALAQLRSRNFFAVLVGDDTQHPAFRDDVLQLIKQHGLEEHVKLVGSTSMMPEAYKLAKLVVATSVEPEAFGRSVLEAQAMGKPVIATNHGGARETVREGATGWLVEPGGVDALAKTIDTALHMEASRYAWMCQQAMEQAQHFTTAAMQEKTMAVYREILKLRAVIPSPLGGEV